MNPVTLTSAMSSASSPALATSVSTPDPTRQLERIDALLAAEEAPIDVHNLLGRCLGDTQFCSIILHKFKARGADQLASLQRALVSNNRGELTDRAHALKGVALNLSAAALAERAAVLENAAQRGDSALETLVADVRQELHRCLRAMPQTLLAVQAHESRTR